MSGEDRHRVLVLGGVRSGKTARAMEIAACYGDVDDQKLYYVATGVDFDLEMKKRIEKHKMSRGSRWLLIEEPFNIDSVIRQKSDKNSTLLIDCLSTWLSNLMTDYCNQEENIGSLEEGIIQGDCTQGGRLESLGDEKSRGDNLFLGLEEFLRSRIEKLIDSVRSAEGNIVFVSSETGLGIIPLGEVVRMFGDVSGEMNQTLAIESDRVVFVVAGIAQEIKIPTC